MRDWGKELESMKVGDTITWPCAVAQVVLLMEGGEKYTLGEPDANMMQTITRIS